MQLNLFSAATDRRPFCFECGTLHVRWFQPLIGIENFCSLACVNRYVAGHQFNGQAQAIHTDTCHHTTPEGETL